MMKPFARKAHRNPLRIKTNNFATFAFATFARAKTTKQQNNKSSIF